MSYSWDTELEYNYCRSCGEYNDRCHCEREDEREEVSEPEPIFKREEHPFFWFMVQFVKWPVLVACYIFFTFVTLMFYIFFTFVILMFLFGIPVFLLTLVFYTGFDNHDKAATFMFMVAILWLLGSIASIVWYIYQSVKYFRKNKVCV